MEQFAEFFALGFEHILAVSGYDHLLFLAVIICMYLPTQWRPLLVLITAFTLGHMATLVAVSIAREVLFTAWIEFLIPTTVVIAALMNMLTLNLSVKQTAGSYRRRYVLAAVFGLVHGLGFANTLISFSSDSSSWVVQLLGFNLGLELGQVLAVVVLVAFGWAMQRWFNLSRRTWVVLVSVLAGALALQLAIRRFPLF